MVSIITTELEATLEELYSLGRAAVDAWLVAEAHLPQAQDGTMSAATLELQYLQPLEAAMMALTAKCYEKGIAMASRGEAPTWRRLYMQRGDLAHTVRCIGQWALGKGQHAAATAFDTLLLHLNPQ